MVEVDTPVASSASAGIGESRDAAAALANGPPPLPTDGKIGAEDQPGADIHVTGGGAGLQEYIAGSAGQSPESSGQAIIAGGDDPEVAILVERGAVMGLGVSSSG